MKLSTLSDEQDAIRAIVMRRITEHGVPASVALIGELEDGARPADVAAVADDLCPGSGKDYLT